MPTLLQLLNPVARFPNQTEDHTKAVNRFQTTGAKFEPIKPLQSPKSPLFALLSRTLSSTTFTSSDIPMAPAPIANGLSDKALESDNHAGSANGFREICGYIEHDGHFIDITEAEHETAMSETEEEHALDVAYLNSNHYNVTAALEKSLNAETKRADDAEQARDTVQKRISDQRRIMEQLGTLMLQRGDAIADLQDRLQQEDHRFALVRENNEFQKRNEELEATYKAKIWQAQESAQIAANQASQNSFYNFQTLLQQRDNMLVERAAMVEQLQARVYAAEQQVDRLAMLDAHHDGLEANNKANARRVRDLLDEKEPLQEELETTRTRNIHLKARIRDVETQLADQKELGQGVRATDGGLSGGPDVFFVAENRRLIEQADTYRGQIGEQQATINRQAERLGELNATNDEVRWKLVWSHQALVKTQEEASNLKPVADKVPQLEKEIDDVYSQLYQAYDHPDRLEQHRRGMTRLYLALNSVKDDLASTKAELEPLQHIAEHHRKHCERIIGSVERDLEFRTNVICALQKQNNFTVRAYDELRKLAGLEAQISPPGMVGVEPIRLRAAFVREAAIWNVKLTDKDIQLIEAQDREMLGYWKQKADGHEKFEDGIRGDEDAVLKRPLTAIERVMLSVMGNIVSALNNTFEDRPMPKSLHPICRELDEQENEDGGEQAIAGADASVADEHDLSGEEQKETTQEDHPAMPRASVFANMKSILDEVRSESVGKAPPKPALKPATLTTVIKRDGDVIDRK